MHRLDTKTAFIFVTMLLFTSCSNYHKAHLTIKNYCDQKYLQKDSSYEYDCELSIIFSDNNNFCIADNQFNLNKSGAQYYYGDFYYKRNIINEIDTIIKLLENNLFVKDTNITVFFTENRHGETILYPSLLPEKEYNITLITNRPIYQCIDDSNNKFVTYAFKDGLKVNEKDNEIRIHFYVVNPENNSKIHFRTNWIKLLEPYCVEGNTYQTRKELKSEYKATKEKIKKIDKILQKGEISEKYNSILNNTKIKHQQTLELIQNELKK